MRGIPNRRRQHKNPTTSTRMPIMGPIGNKYLPTRHNDDQCTDTQYKERKGPNKTQSEPRCHGVDSVPLWNLVPLTRPAIRNPLHFQQKGNRMKGHPKIRITFRFIVISRDRGHLGVKQDLARFINRMRILCQCVDSLARVNICLDSFNTRPRHVTWP